MRNPYVTGGHVTGHKHYGRHDLIDHLLHGAGRAYLVVGNRRIGKTSLLRQLELQAISEGALAPLYWDMQGGDTIERLGQYLADAVRDASPQFEALLGKSETLPEHDLLAALALLRRAALRTGKELLLLCDEAEALVRIVQDAPEAAQRLHRQLTAAPGLRVVMTATRAVYQLHDVCCGWSTSPFLVGFDVSQTLGSLEPADARGLIRQTQAESPVQVEPTIVDAISECTNDHPYLIQLLCARLFQGAGWLRAINDDDLQVEPGLRGFFANDFSSLTEADRRVVWAVHDASIADERAVQEMVEEPPVQLHQRLRNLESLGYLRRVYGRWAIGNQFLLNWLASERSNLGALPVAATSETAMRTALATHQAQEVTFLIARLNARRNRLVELEAQRARDLLATSPQLLAEIAHLQDEITHLRRLVDEVRAA